MEGNEAQTGKIWGTKRCQKMNCRESVFKKTDSNTEKSQSR
jgi:hypothetical protein